MIKQERIGNQTLILGDCLEVMPTLGVFDCCVTDPPYGINQDKGFDGYGGYGKPIARRKYSGQWDNERPKIEFFCEIQSKAKLQIIWGGQYFADLLPAQGKWLWWDKCQTMPTYGDGELAWTNLSGNAPKKFVYSNNGLHAKEKNKQHPTQKPVALMSWCLGFVTDAQTILDPFMGSGTTLVACQKLGRFGTGIERDPQYFQIACERVHDEWSRPDMFASEAKEETPQQIDLLEIEK